MLNEGVPVEIITKLTGYSVEDLVRMKDQKETIVGTFMTGTHKLFRVAGMKHK
jgi:hypothetical protein